MNMLDWLILVWFRKFDPSHAYEVYTSLREMMPVSRSTIYRRIKVLFKSEHLCEHKRKKGRGPKDPLHVQVIYRITKKGREATQTPPGGLPTVLEIITALWLEAPIPMASLLKARKNWLIGMWMAGSNNPHQPGLARTYHDYYFAGINQEIAFIEALLGDSQ